MTPTTVAPKEITELLKDDKTAIRKMMDRWIESEKANDLEALGRFWARDAIFMPPNHEVLEGREAILNWLRSKEFKVQDVSCNIQEVEGYGDLAYVRGSYSETFTTKELREPTREKGKFFGVVRRQPDGNWLTTRWTWNADLPRPG